MNWLPTTPAITPAIPPNSDTSTASTRNWIRMSLRRAPTALRIPISRVRSVTDTSMMFITPIPPTSSEIAATSPSSVVNTPLVELEACRIEPWLMTLKLLVVEPALGGWSWLRMSVTSVCAALELIAGPGLDGDRVDVP